MTYETRVGLIGCGFFAQNHLHAWSSLRGEGARIVAVCDIDPAKAKAAAANFEASHWYTDPERMLAEQNLGLVDIVTRMDTHREFGRTCRPTSNADHCSEADRTDSRRRASDGRYGRSGRHISGCP
jgi:hypothetical protein